MPGLGDRFRTARESRGLSLSEAAEQLRIRSVYLAAIEEENWGAIGAPVYIRGFLRTYARFLGLDPQEAVEEYRVETNGETGRPSDGERPPHGEPGYDEGSDDSGRRRASAAAIWGLSLVAVAMVAFVVYNEVAMRAKPSPVAAALSSPTLVPSAQSPAPSPIPSPVRVAQTLQLRLDAPSWLSVTVDGNASIVGTFPAGTDRTFRGKSATIRLGNAGAVEVLVDGKSLGKLGGSGAVVERTFAL
ncbi:MAG: helix-turn-helix domain-containing protein [Vulcanimicrobiaceae bacterium]